MSCRILLSLIAVVTFLTASSSRAFAADDVEEPTTTAATPTEPEQPPPLPASEPDAAVAASGRDQAAAGSPASQRRRPPPKNAISLQILSLFNSGIAVQYERFVAPPRFSLAGGVGYRRSGGTDFDVVEGTLGMEGRFWLIGKDGFSHFDGRAMVGPFVGARFDFGYTKVTDEHEDRSLGSTLRFAEALQLGARVTVAQRVEITPSFGIGLRHEIDPSGRLAAWSRPEFLRFGLTVGVLF